MDVVWYAIRELIFRGGRSLFGTQQHAIVDAGSRSSGNVR